MNCSPPHQREETKASCLPSERLGPYKGQTMWDPVPSPAPSGNESPSTVSGSLLEAAWPTCANVYVTWEEAREIPDPIRGRACQAAPSWNSRCPLALCFFLFPSRQPQPLGPKSFPSSLSPSPASIFLWPLLTSPASLLPQPHPSNNPEPCGVAAQCDVSGSAPFPGPLLPASLLGQLPAVLKLLAQHCHFQEVWTSPLFTMPLSL